MVTVTGLQHNLTINHHFDCPVFSIYEVFQVHSKVYVHVKWTEVTNAGFWWCLLGTEASLVYLDRKSSQDRVSAGDASTSSTYPKKEGNHG